MRRKDYEQRPAARARRAEEEKTSSAADLAGSEKFVGGGAAAKRQTEGTNQVFRFPLHACRWRTAALEAFETKRLIDVRLARAYFSKKKKKWIINQRSFEENKLGTSETRAILIALAARKTLSRPTRRGLCRRGRHVR